MNTPAATYLLEKFGKKNPPQVKPGDTVRVHQRIKEGAKERVQIFEGLVIATKHGLSLDGSFTVRKIAAGTIGVEKTYPVHSPNILKVERIKNAEVLRAKLYYMRDRKGKSARFKNEGPSYFTWDESNVAAAAEAAPEMEMLEEAVAAVEPEVEVAEAPAMEIEAEKAETLAEVTEDIVAAEEPEAAVEEVAATEEPATEEEKAA